LVHGADVFENVRVVFGHSVPDNSGNFKEKGIDALLAADLIYHAASRNYDFAILISVDTDFAQALKRVDDFGRRTAVIGVCARVPELLQEAADDVRICDQKFLHFKNWVQPI